MCLFLGRGDECFQSIKQVNKKKTYHGKTNQKKAALAISIAGKEESKATVVLK